jgi:hypothetical protein
MSLSLKSKFNEQKNSKEYIQNLIKSNFETEGLADAKSFFWDDAKKEYKNQSYLQYSFLDFWDAPVKPDSGFA